MKLNRNNHDKKMILSCFLSICWIYVESKFTVYNLYIRININKQIQNYFG